MKEIKDFLKDKIEQKQFFLDIIKQHFEFKPYSQSEKSIEYKSDSTDYIFKEYLDNSNLKKRALIKDDKEIYVETFSNNNLHRFDYNRTQAQVKYYNTNHNGLLQTKKVKLKNTGFKAILPSLFKGITSDRLHFNDHTTVYFDFKTLRFNLEDRKYHQRLDLKIDEQGLIIKKSIVNIEKVSLLSAFEHLFKLKGDPIVEELDNLKKISYKHPSLGTLTITLENGKLKQKEFFDHKNYKSIKEEYNEDEKRTSFKLLENNKIKYQEIYLENGKKESLIYDGSERIKNRRIFGKNKVPEILTHYDINGRELNSFHIKKFNIQDPKDFRFKIEISNGILSILPNNCATFKNALNKSKTFQIKDIVSEHEIMRLNQELESHLNVNTNISTRKKNKLK